MSLAAVTAIVVGMLAPASALAQTGPVEVGHTALGTSLGAVVPSADGGAWVRVQRRSGSAIGRATAAGGFRVVGVPEPLNDQQATLGPDGQGWFAVGSFLERSDLAGGVVRAELSERLGDVMATGPDGTLWAVGDDVLHRVTPQNVVTDTPLTVPACKTQSQLRAFERASDGAMWIADAGCSRLLRIAPDATVQPVDMGKDEAPIALAPDLTGGMWFAQAGVPVRIGHVAATGAITRMRPSSRYGAVTGLAADPADGSPYFAFGRCVLGHVTAAGTFGFQPAPIPARNFAFGSDGTLWLASAARLVKTLPSAAAGATCDDRPPAVRLQPAFKTSVSLAQLRHGFRITTREPTTVTVTPFYGSEDDGQATFKLLPSHHGGTLTFRVPAARIRAYARDLAAHRKPDFSLYVEATDVDGNLATAGGGGRRVTGS